MKNHKIKIGLIIVTVLLAISGGYLFWKDNMTIIVVNDENNILLERYNSNLKIIENNLNEVSTSNEDGTIKWYFFKKRDIDEQLLNIYDNLIADLRICYIYATDDGTNYTDSNYINRFKDYDKIKQKDFDNLIIGYNFNNSGCLERFNRYDSWIDNSSKFEEIKYFINEIQKYFKEIEYKEFNNYNEVIRNEDKKIGMLKEISEYLKRKL